MRKDDEFYKNKDEEEEWKLVPFFFFFDLSFDAIERKHNMCLALVMPDIA